MKYSLGDRVCITKTGKTGTVCDVREIEGRSIYIIDCFDECDSKEFLDCVVTVNENEIETLVE